MVASVENSYYQKKQSMVIELFFKRPGLLFVLALILISYLIQIRMQIRIDFFAQVLVFTPLIPVVLLENEWNNKVKKGEKNALLFYEIIKANRLAFVFAGFILSFFLYSVSDFLVYILHPMIYFYDEFYISYPTQEDITFTVFLLIAFSTFLVGLGISASFYRIRGEEYDTGRRYTFISSPSQIMTLVSYATMGSFVMIWVIWIIRIIVTVPDKRRTFEFTPFIDYIFGSDFFSIIIVIYLTFLYAIYFGANEIPRMRNNSSYKLPSRNVIGIWIAKIVIILCIFSYLAYFRYQADIRDFENWIIFDSIFFISVHLIYFLLIRRLDKGGTTCNFCNLLLINEKCTSCEVADSSINYSMKKNKAISHPICPKCGNSWNSLNLSCNAPICNGCSGINCKGEKCGGKCDYTISLTCEYCGSTVNPLWKQCIDCNRERKNIVERALKAPGSEGFVRSQGYLRILLAIFIPITIMQISQLILLIIQVLTGQFSVYATNYVWYRIYLASGTIIILVVVIISLVFGMMYTSNEKTRSLSLVANRVAIFPGSVLMQFAFMNFLYQKIHNFDRSRIFSSSLLLLFAIFILIGSIRGHFRMILSFRPVTPFDPKFSLGHRIDVK